MKRARLALSTLSALLLSIAPALGQSAEPDAKPVRLQPKEQTTSEQINDVFGDLIGALTHYPFHNVAPWFGLDVSPQFLRDEKGQRKAQATTLTGHAGAVKQALFSPDGKQVLTLGADNTVRLFNLRAEQITSQPHPGAVETAAFFPGGGEFVTGSADGKIRVFAPAKDDDGKAKKDADDKPVWEVTATIDAGTPIQALTYSKDGSWLASTAADGTVVLWNAMGKKSATLSGATDGVRSVHITAAETRGEEVVAIVDGAGNLRLHKANGTAIQDITGAGITGIQLDAGGTHILARTGATTLKLYKPDGTEVAGFSQPDGADLLRAKLAVEDDTVTVVTVDGKGTRRVFNGKGEVTETVKDGAGIGDGFLTQPGVQPNTYVLKGYGGDETWELTGHGGPILGSAFTADGQRLVTYSADGTAKIWEWFVRAPDGKTVSMNIPFVVLWLVVAAVIFTIYMKFVNLRLFRHAIQVVRGKFSDPNDAGEVSHFQALASALSATVGLGNIAGVAIAVSVGGPGATFWMVVAGLLGMTLKFTECTLGQKFRKIDEHGQVSGGPMHYLWDGMVQKGLGVLGVPLAIIFTVFCIGGSLAGGNAFQVNQSAAILKGQVPFFAEHPEVYGIILAVLVGIVIIGGIKRIAQTAETIVPTMCGLYVLAALIVLVMNFDQIPGAVGAIFGSALSGDAIYGGALGALATGFRRAAFSNEAGVGSASIAHSAARTPYAVREGIVALLEPFIDTVVVCSMTALVIVITGVYDVERFPEYAHLVAGNQGAGLTSQAFGLNPLLAGWFPWVLMVAVILFAFSTMISWSYYGERCWTNLFGPRSSLSFKILFLIFTVLGSIVTATNVLEFGDVMILLMAFPNILGLYFLGGLVKKDLGEYEGMLSRNEFKTFK